MVRNVYWQKSYNASK